MNKLTEEDICTRCNTLTIEGADPAWYYGSAGELKMTFITHDCEG